MNKKNHDLFYIYKHRGRDKTIIVIIDFDYYDDDQIGYNEDGEAYHL